MVAVSLRVGAKLPNSGPLPLRLGIPALASTLEAAGFESLWVSDHIVMPASIDSVYPFAADGKATWPPDTPYLDALVALALAAAVTERASLGTAVLVLPLRNPVEFAKQAASIDVASGGRLSLGVGAGWLEEEFAALGVPFAERGARLRGVDRDRAGMLDRAPGGVGLGAIHAAARHALPAHSHPGAAPARRRPFPRRAATGWTPRRAAGWPSSHFAKLAPDELERAAALMRGAAAEAGRDPAMLAVVLRIVETAGRAAELAPRLPALRDAGVDEIIVDVAWEDGDPASDYALLRDGADAS